MVAEGITTSHYRQTAVVRVEGTLEEVALLIGPQVGVLQREGEHTRLELGIDDFDWLPAYLIGLGLAFEVEEPPALRAHVAALGERLQQANRA
jgi:predicted DNA-binding transcriptional regulator YafY